MRVAAAARKLRDIAAAQDAEIAALTAELRRLEDRTFPRFPNAPRAAGSGTRRVAR